MHHVTFTCDRTHSRFILTQTGILVTNSLTRKKEPLRTLVGVLGGDRNRFHVLTLCLGALQLQQGRAHVVPVWCVAAILDCQCSMPDVA